jgi:hypothetical protein
MEGSGLSRSVLPASANYAQAKKGRIVMAYIHFAKSKAQSIESFRMVSARHNPPQEIDGLLAWAAGTDENGLNVVTVWGVRGAQGPLDSRAALSRVPGAGPRRRPGEH